MKNKIELQEVHDDNILSSNAIQNTIRAMKTMVQTLLK